MLVGRPLRLQLYRNRSQTRIAISCLFSRVGFRYSQLSGARPANFWSHGLEHLGSGDAVALSELATRAKPKVSILMHDLNVFAGRLKLAGVMHKE
jgi:hypothetical protein